MRSLALAAAIVGAQATPSETAPIWPDTWQARATAMYDLQALEHRLLVESSATLVLDDWCAGHHLAPPGSKIVAQRILGPSKMIPAALRKHLRVPARTALRYRRVRLACGDRVLSEADNWYVAARLTPAMNRTLDATDQPFGRIVKPLGFRRRTLSAMMLWRPMTAKPSPDAKRLVMPDHVIENRAVLIGAAGAPFSVVIERYTSQVLAFPPPAP